MSYDEKAKRYRFQAFTGRGNYEDAEAKVTEGQLVWGMKIPQFGETSRGRTLMSLIAVSPEMRHHFLAPWPQYPARRRTAVIADRPLIGWHPGAHLPISVPLAA